MATNAALINNELVSAKAETHNLLNLNIYRLQSFQRNSYRIMADTTAACPNAATALYQRLCQKRHLPGNPSVK
jgi:hypothetical protein